MFGNKVAKEGEVITVFVNDPDNPANQQFSLLYVKVSFNIGQQMALFYDQVPATQRAQPTEKAMESFYIYLLKKGLVDRPKNTVIYLGDHGKLPVSIIDEYKYSINPIEWILEHITQSLMFQTNTFLNHQGYRIMLLGPSGSLSEIAVEIMHEDLSLGMVQVGIVFDRTLDAVLNEDDILAIRTTISKMFNLGQYPTGVSIGRMYINLLPLLD